MLTSVAAFIRAGLAVLSGRGRLAYREESDGGCDTESKYLADS